MMDKRSKIELTCTTAILALLAAVILSIIYGCSEPTASSPSLHDQVKGASVPAQAENDLLKKQVQTLTEQNTLLAAAVDQLTKTGTLIDQAKALNAKAAGQAADKPDAVNTLANQKMVLDQSKNSNDAANKQLTDLQTQNKVLADQAAALTTANAALRVQLQALSDASDAKDKEVTGLRGNVATLTTDNTELKQKMADKDKDDIRKSLLWAMAPCVMLALAGGLVIWKSDVMAGLGMVAVGLMGLGLCIFATIYMVQIAIFIGVLAFVALAAFGYIAYNKLHVDAGSIVKGVQAGIEAGKIKLEDVAGIFNAVQTPTAKKLVNSATTGAK